MQNVIVQFTDNTETIIVSYFGSMPPNPDDWPNLGEVSTSDPRWLVFFNSQSPWNQPYLPQPTTDGAE